jgi:hypothetical protein
MTKSTAIAVKEETLPVSAAQQAQWAEDAGQGLEQIGAKDIAIPFLGHVQSQSKQLVEGDPKFLADARVGSVFNTVTGEVFGGKDGVTVVPVDITKVVVEKEPKGTGGKIVAVYASHAEAEQKKQRGNDLLDGYRVILLYQGKDGSWVPAVLSMGTKSKVYTMRNWNALMSGLRVPGPNGTKIQPPTFAWTYKLTSAMMEFNEGTAAVLKATATGPAPEDAYTQAKDLRKALAAGAVKLGTDEETQAVEPTQPADDLPY